MRLLIDTNIVIDFLTQRKPFAEKSTQVIKSCIDGKFLGFIAPHSIINIFYILRKDYSQSDLRRMLLNLCKVFEMPEINGHSIANALENSTFSDFEDCVQSGCAAEVNAARYACWQANVQYQQFFVIPVLRPDNLLFLQ